MSEEIGLEMPVSNNDVCPKTGILHSFTLRIFTYIELCFIVLLHNIFKKIGTDPRTMQPAF